MTINKLNFTFFTMADAEHYKRDDVNKFYNSIKLLGEYFNKARNSNGSPINILGQSLLNLLNLELEKELKTLFHFKNDSFSELILTQVRLMLTSFILSVLNAVYYISDGS